MPLSAPEPLGQNQHVVEFDCGEPALNDWLIRHARQAQASGSAKTSELIALRWQDVDLAKQCIHVRVARVRGINKPTKTPAGMRQVNLQPEALAALLDQKKLKGAADIVFHNPRTNKPWDDDQGIRKVVWTPVLQRAVD